MGIRVVFLFAFCLAYLVPPPRTRLVGGCFEFEFCVVDGSRGGEGESMCASLVCLHVVF